MRGAGPSRLDPAAGVALAPVGDDPEGGAGLGHRRLEGAHERPEQQAAPGQRDDRIGDELAAAVVRDLATALDPDDLDPARGEELGRGADMALVGLAAEGQDRRVLDEQELVRDPVRRRARPRAASGGPTHPRYPARPSQRDSIGRVSGVSIGGACRGGRPGPRPAR